MRQLNWVKFATATTGTSDIAVGSADTGFITPAQAGVANNDRVPYVIDDGTDWAYGLGVYSTTGPTLARDTNEVRVVSGTKSTAKLSLSGSAKVMISGVEGVLPMRPDVLSQTSASSLTPDITNYTDFRFTALAANLSIANPSGTPFDGQKIRFEFRDNGTERTLTWGNGYALAGGPLTTGDSTKFARNVEFTYNAGRSKWVVTDAFDEPTAYQTIQYVGGFEDSDDNSGGDSISLTALTGGLAAAPVENDVVIVALGFGSAGDIDVAGAVTSSGWSLVSEQNASDTSDANMGVFIKRMGAVPDTSFNFTVPGAIPWVAITQAFRGVDTTTAQDVTATGATGTNSGNANPPSITPVTPGAVVVSAGMQGDATTSDFTGHDLTNFVVRSHVGSTDCTVGVGYTAPWVSGAVDPVAWTGSAGTSAAWVAQSIALRPQTLN